MTYEFQRINSNSKHTRSAVNKVALRFVATLLLTATLPVTAADIVVVSKTPTGNNGSLSSQHTAISEDGNLVIFNSKAPNLVADDLDNEWDIFLYNKSTQTNTLVSRNTAGEKLNDFSWNPDMGGAGTVAVFYSTASNTNLPTAPPGGGNTILYKNLESGELRHIDVELPGTQGQFSGQSRTPAIDSDGHTIVFASTKPNLVINDNNGTADIFLYDIFSPELIRISLDSMGLEADDDSQEPDISADGKFVVFDTEAALVPTDTNRERDVYRWSRDTNTIELVSAKADIPGFPIPVRPPRPTDLIVGDDASYHARISGDGRYVVFTTQADNFFEAGNLTNVVLVDMQTRELQRINVNSAGERSNRSATVASISDSGHYAAFKSSATNMGESVLLGSNVFIRDLEAQITEPVSVVREGNTDNIGFILISSYFSISNDGAQVAFDYIGLPANGNGTTPVYQIYLRERGAECNVDSAFNKFDITDGIWRLLSLPCAPPMDTTIEDLFGDDIAGDYGDTWAIFTYDASVVPAQYELASADSQIKHGQGFWIQQFSGATVTLDLPKGSRQINTWRPPGGCSEAAVNGCTSTDLSGNGTAQVVWNLVGQPFSETFVRFNDVVVTTTNGPCSLAGISRCSLDDADSADTVGNVLFSYDGTVYTAQTTNSLLFPWEGYWIPELQAANGNNPQLVFPK